MASASTIQPTPASEKSQYFDAPISQYTPSWACYTRIRNPDSDQPSLHLVIIKSSGDDTSGTVAPGPDRAAPASIDGSAPTKSGSAAIAESKSPKDSHGTIGVSRVRSLLTKRRSLKKKPPPADETKASAPIVTSGTIPPATKSSISNPGQTDSSKFQDPISAAIDCAIVKDAANAANTSSEPTSPGMQPQTTAPSMPVPQTLESFTSRIANESIEPELSRTYLPPAQTQSPREPHSETFAKTTSPLASNATGETKSIIAPSTKSRASRAANTTGDAPTEHLSRRASHRSNKSYRSRRSHRSHASRRHDRDYERDYDHGRRHKQSRSAPGSRRGPVSDDETASESDSATGSDFESVESDEADEAGYMSPVSHNRRAHRERGSRYDDDRRSRRSSMPARPRSMHHGHEHDEDRDQRTESGMKRSGTAMSRRSMAVSTVSTSGGAFASGAGTIGPGALPDPGDAEPFRTRAVDAARNLSTKQAKKITKEERECCLMLD
jgi:hypothetical protein